MNSHAPPYRWASLTIVVCILAECATEGYAPVPHGAYGCDRNGGEEQRRAC